MTRIKGYFEWDDPSLTPSAKKEGGLHQNLFDADGNLKGHARFIPSDSHGDDFTVTESTFISAEERRRTQEEDELVELVSDIISRVLIKAAVAARPHIEQWWREAVQPRLEAKRKEIADRRARKKARKPAPAADETPGPDMSLAEAQARMLAALAAQAYSAEQMRLVNGANIIAGDGSSARPIEEVQQSLALLPAESLTKLLTALASNPAMLQEDNLARLASMMGPLTEAAQLRST